MPIFARVMNFMSNINNFWFGALDFGKIWLWFGPNGQGWQVMLCEDSPRCVMFKFTYNFRADDTVEILIDGFRSSHLRHFVFKDEKTMDLITHPSDYPGWESRDQADKTDLPNLTSEGLLQTVVQVFEKRAWSELPDFVRLKVMTVDKGFPPREIC